MARNAIRSFRTGGRSGTIRGRLTRLLAAAAITILILLGIGVAGALGDYREADATTDAVGLTLTIQDLVHQLQRERGLTNGVLGGDEAFRAELTAQRGRADSARTALVRAVDASSAAVRTGVQDALRELDGVATVRADVDAARAARAATFTFYTARITALSRLRLGLDEARDQALRQHVAALHALGEAKEAAAQERGFLNGVFAAGRFGADEYVQFVDVRAAKRAALAQFDRYATDAQRDKKDAALRSPAATQAAANEAAALDGADGRPLGVNAPRWWTAMTTLIDDLHAVQSFVGADIRARAGTLRDDAVSQLLLVALVAVLAVAGQVVLAVLGARSITRPLAQLAREAEQMATRRLPSAVTQVLAADGPPAPPPAMTVPQGAATEIRSMATAFDKVHQVAFTLAVEQAVVRRNTTESLANLGRRTQNLLRRQLGFISQLEREETNPSTLANLFELDHLATRMRRNAESLLVLVGEESPRMWSEPLPMGDVIRAAIAEVEEYRRVVLRRIDDAHVSGAVVTDVAHMIAELVENGLAFSPPDLDVEIFGRWAGNQYMIVIMDQGVGMRADDLARANARLRGSETFLVAPTRFLGHYVVGRLAQRLSVDVQLAESPLSGITARLVLPPDILTGPTGSGPAAGAAIASIGSATVDRPAPSEPPAIVDATFSDWRSADWSEPAALTASVFNDTDPAVGGPDSDDAVRDDGRNNVTVVNRQGAPWPPPPPADTYPPRSAAGRAQTDGAGTSTAGETGASAPERTRNGLRKRISRDRTRDRGTDRAPGRHASTRTRGTDRTPAETGDDVAVRPPEDVGAMLSRFQAGVQRGRQRWATEPTESLMTVPAPPSSPQTSSP